MNPDTIGCVWTGEFDLNTLRVECLSPEIKSYGFINIGGLSVTHRGYYMPRVDMNVILECSTRALTREISS